LIQYAENVCHPMAVKQLRIPTNCKGAKIQTRLVVIINHDNGNPELKAKT
jgi:hypothetical protein